MRKTLIVALVVGACSSSPPAPSCAQSVGHYYASGCVFVDSTGATIPEATFANDCQQAASMSPSNCLDDLDAWTTCMNDVPASATNAQCQVCSQEQMTLIECH